MASNGSVKSAEYFGVGSSEQTELVSAAVGDGTLSFELEAPSDHHPKGERRRDPHQNAVPGPAIASLFFFFHPAPRTTRTPAAQWWHAAFHSVGGPHLRLFQPVHVHALDAPAPTPTPAAAAAAAAAAARRSAPSWARASWACPPP
jgi:hypothetical protein